MLAIRAPIIGWFEIMEIFLTVLLTAPDNAFDKVMEIFGNYDSYADSIVTVEGIIFNKQQLLKANIFERKYQTKEELEKAEVKNDYNINYVIYYIQNSIAKWYYILRLASIAFMLLVLIFIGIKAAASTISAERAMYKKMLVDWLVGFILVFTIHYIMLLIININDVIVNAFSDVVDNITLEEYEYGTDDNKEKKIKELIKERQSMESSLYETARTRAYTPKIKEGVTGTIIYGVLVYYAWKFALIYFRRLLNIIILTLFAPIVSASYAFNKVLTGKSKVFSTWMTEYIQNVIIQIFHVVIYTVFVSMALEITMKSITGSLFMFVIFYSMEKAERLLRQLFKVTGGKGSLVGDMAERTTFRGIRKEVKDTMNAMVGGKLTKAGIKLAMKPAKDAIATGAAYVLANLRARNKTAHGGDDKDALDAQKFIDSDFEATRLAKQIEADEEKRNQLMEKDNLTAKEEEELRKTIDNITKNQGKLDQRYLEYKQNQDVSILGVGLSNFKKGLDSLIEEEVDADGNGTGKFKVKKIETTTSKGKKAPISYRMLGKVNDSFTIRFKNNMKLNKLFNINSAQQKVLKAELDFWKNNIKGFGLSVAGIPVFGTHPLVGLGLFMQSASAASEFAKRRKYYKKRYKKLNLYPPSSAGHKMYQFTAFGGKTVDRLKFAHSLHMIDIQALDRIQTKLMKNEAKKVQTNTSIKRRKENEINKRAIITKSEFNQKKEEVITNKKNEIDQKTTKELAIEEKLRERNVVNVGSNIAMQISSESEKAKKDFIKAIRQMDTDEQKKKSIQNVMNEKIDGVNNPAFIKIDNNSRLLITYAIVDICKKSNITIEQFQLTNGTKDQINRKLRIALSKQGVKNVNELLNIDDKDLNLLIKDLKDNKDHINRFITGESSELKDKTNEVLENINKTVVYGTTNTVLSEIQDKKKELIKEAILDLCMQNKVLNIDDVLLTDDEIMQINQNVLDMVEVEAGVSIKEQQLVNQTDVKNVLAQLQKKKENTNDQIDERLVDASILEYIDEKKITDASQLQLEIATDEILEKVKNKRLSDSSKQSASVIKLIKKKQNTDKDEIAKLSPEEEAKIKKLIETKSKKVEKINLDSLKVDEKDKNDLKNRALNTEMAEMRRRLEKATYLETAEQVDSYGYYNLTAAEMEKEKNDLKIVSRSDDDPVIKAQHKRMIFQDLKNKKQKEIRKDLSKDEIELLEITLQAINENRKKSKLGSKNENNTTESTKSKLKNYDKKDGSKRFDETKDGSRRVREVDKLIHGTALDVVNLLKKIKV